MGTAKTTSVLERFRPRGRNWPLIFAYIIACGGATKTTTGTSLAVTMALRGYPGIFMDLDANLSATRVLGYSVEHLKGRKTVFDLITGNATFEEVVVPARYSLGEDEDGVEQFAEIPNLRLIPGSPDLAGADTYIALDPDRNDWFMEFLHGYDGDDCVLHADFPASYGKMVYSVARMLDEDDSVIPSVRADPKDVGMIPDLLKELGNIREKNKNKRSIPGRPTFDHLVLTGTPTPSYVEAAARRAVTKAEGLYPQQLLPKVRYSADAKKMYEDLVPLPILLPNSYPAEDYRKVATAMGFEQL
ncbi:ParA family protein [Streptomyces sp. NPDC058595]|uniref:ParA family protein n=1 Tax=Streptomyces sp. NPDC058595 TaxID=3346550 RepID=UPI00365EF060